MARRYTIRPFDDKDAVSTLAAGEVLGVRLDTRFMGVACDKGAFDWCPDWGEYNGQNPWVPCSTCKAADHYLWVSFRAKVSAHSTNNSQRAWVLPWIPFLSPPARTPRMGRQHVR